MCKLRNIFSVFALLALTALPSRAQFIGYTSPQTVNQSVFATATCGPSLLKSANLTNVGQSVHVVNYVLNAGAGNQSPIVRIMGSSDGANWTQLSDDGTSTLLLSSQVSTLTGYGAYPFVQVWVVNGASGCTITANYMGTSVSTTNPAGSTDATAYYKIIAANIGAGSTFTDTVLTPYGNSAGAVSVAYSGGAGPAGSTIQVETEDPNTLTFSIIATYNLAVTQSLAQVFPIPAGIGPYVAVVYTAGTTSTSEVGISYAFSKPGSQVPQPQCSLTKVLNTAGAGPTQEIAAVTGASVRICSLVVSSGTAEAIDFQQGTGTNCGTNNGQLTGVTHLAANTPWIEDFPGGGLVGAQGEAVCIHLSAGNQTDGTITYSQY